MTPRARRPVAFDPRSHLTDGFDSGQPSLDIWLQRFAGQSQRRDAARTFVTSEDGLTVIGYYALIAGELTHGRATPRVSRGMSKRFPIPVALLARLAVDRRHHGRGIGSSLLLDALDRVLLASERVATRAVVVDAISDAAAGFYEHHGFRPLSDDPRTLMINLDEIRDSLASESDRR